MNSSTRPRCRPRRNRSRRSCRQARRNPTRRMPMPPYRATRTPFEKRPSPQPPTISNDSPTPIRSSEDSEPVASANAEEEIVGDFIESEPVQVTPRDRVTELCGLYDDAYAFFLARGRSPQEAIVLAQLFVQTGGLNACL